MRPTLKFIWLIITVAILFPPTISAAGDKLFPPAEYILSKLQQNDIVFLGTTHKKPEILSFIADLTLRFAFLQGCGAERSTHCYGLTTNRQWLQGPSCTSTSRMCTALMALRKPRIPNAISIVLDLWWKPWRSNANFQGGIGTFF